MFNNTLNIANQYKKVLSTEAKDKFPLVTIGVTSYNYSEFILDSLNSLLALTYLNIEIVIIDDCSTDNCPDIISKWIIDNKITCTYIKHEQNKGITKTLNEIIRLAKGKYISLFATDDIMLPEKISEQVRILENAGEEYGICYANTETMDESGNPTGIYDKEYTTILEGNVLHEYVFRRLRFVTPSTLINKNVYKKVGLYNEKVLIEDYNFWIRALSCFKVKYTSYPCLIYRQKKESVVWNKWMANHKELYNYDSIISNLQGKRYIKENEVLKHLTSKNKKYLYLLSKYKSRLFFKAFTILFFRGYIFSSLKSLLRYVFQKRII